MESRIDVHVDAKIINRDDRNKPKRTFVAYVISDSDESEYKEIKAEDAAQTDAAELYAIEFAIEKLKTRQGCFVLLCDNESVVLVLNRSKDSSGGINGRLQENYGKC